jgi:hypothetical protein
MSRARTFAAALVTASAAIVAAFVMPASSPHAHASPPAIAIPRAPAAHASPSQPVVSTEAFSTPLTVVVAPGDTLSSLAARYYGSAATWPALWWTNRGEVHNPNSVRTGQVLTLSPWHPKAEWLLHAAQQAAAPPPQEATLISSAQPIVSAGVTRVNASDYSGFQGCVISRESGGDPYAQNPVSTASGLYGFLDSTWTAITGLPGPARDYSVAEQNAAFEKEYQEDGTSPWAPYDGC